MRTVLALIVLTVVVALALTLGAENQQFIRLNYLLAQDEFRLSTLLVMLFACKKSVDNVVICTPSALLTIAISIHTQTRAFGTYHTGIACLHLTTRSRRSY